MRPWWALLLVPLAGCLSDAPQTVEGMPACTAPEGITCADEDGTFTVSGTSAQADGSWMLVVDTPRLVLEDLRGPGMQVVCHPRACDVEVRNVTLAGSERAGLHFAHRTHGEYMLVGNMSIHGLTLDAPGASLTIGELGPAASLTVDGLRMRCHGEGGVLAIAFQTMTLRGLQMDDCAGLTIHGNGSRDVSLELRDATLRGSGMDLIGLRGTASIENLTVTEAESGMVVLAEGPLQVDVRDSTFARNGHGIMLVEGDLRIRGSSFEGTKGDAVCTRAGGTTDAADNWWGSPTGPIPGVAGVPVPAKPAETVCAGVVTTPHRTSP